MDGPGNRNNTLAGDINERGNVVVQAPDAVGIVNIVA